jgi:hypothetical protein
MVLEESETKNDCAGEDQQQFNRLTDKPTDKPVSQSRKSLQAERAMRI